MVQSLNPANNASSLAFRDYHAPARPPLLRHRASLGACTARSQSSLRPCTFMLVHDHAGPRGRPPLRARHVQCVSGVRRPRRRTCSGSKAARSRSSPSTSSQIRCATARWKQGRRPPPLRFGASMQAEDGARIWGPWRVPRGGKHARGGACADQCRCWE